MLRTRSVLRLARSYTTSPSPHALVFLEHAHGVVDSASLSALTAASQLGGQVTGLVVGSSDQIGQVLDKAKTSVTVSVLGFLVPVTQKPIVSKV
jgi:electron transfer flavoprotein alpha subunit